DIEALARLVHVDDAAREVERIGAFVDQNRVRIRFDDVAHDAQRAVEVHRGRVLLERFGHPGDVLALALRDRAQPLGRRPAPAAAYAGEQRRYARTDVADQRRIDAHVAVGLGRRNIDLDEFLAAPVLRPLAA